MTTSDPSPSSFRRIALYASAMVAMLSAVGMSTSSAALAASHSRASHSRVVLSVAATNEGLTVHVRAPAGSRCTLTVAAGHRSSTFAPITLGKSGRGTIKWTVPSSVVMR